MRKKLFLFLLAAGIIISLTGTAHSDSLMIPASTFIPGGPNHPGLDSYNGEELFNYFGATYTLFFAPVHLPQNAQVTSVVVYYQDNSAGHINIQFERRNLVSLAVHDLAEWDTEGEVSGLRNHKISPISYGMINNEGYTYWLFLRYSDGSAGTDLTIYGIKINYNAP